MENKVNCHPNQKEISRRRVEAGEKPSIERNQVRLEYLDCDL